jgi:hypothetical protein
MKSTMTIFGNGYGIFTGTASPGIPTTDRFGHSGVIKFKVRPIQIDIITGLKERMPDGWFSNQSQLFRGIMAAGCFTLIKLLKEDEQLNRREQVREYEGILESLNKIQKAARLNDLKEEIQEWELRVLRSRMEDKSKVVNLLDEWKKKIEKEEL